MLSDVLLPWGIPTVLLVLVAAKAHGRQVRLERERVGVMSVDFRKENGPVVEAIWRRDRITLWAAAAGFAFVLGWFFWNSPFGHPAAWIWAFVALWAFAGGFIAAGLTAFARLLVPRHTDVPGWRRAALLGSLLWWSAVAAVAVGGWLVA